jgi:hypothetical protein
LHRNEEKYDLMYTFLTYRIHHRKLETSYLNKIYISIVTPLDVVKIRLQAQNNPFPKGMYIKLFKHI